jgi:hypothetical protein
VGEEVWVKFELCIISVCASEIRDGVQKTHGDRPA